MKTPTPTFDAEKYADLPAEYDEPKLDFSFDEIAAADDLDREEIVNLDRLWTVLCRAWDSPRTVLSPPEVVEIVDVYLDRERRLDRDDREKLETFLAELGALRSPGRSFEALTAIEYQIIQLVQPPARRNLSSGALVSATLSPDEPADPALDLRDAFERKRLAIADADEPETDAGGEP